MDSKNLILASILSIGILLGWHYYYDLPRQKELARIAELKKKEESEKKKVAAVLEQRGLTEPVDRSDVLKKSARIKIATTHLHGSLPLQGSRFDDLTLPGYKQTLDPASQDVVLLSPSDTNDVYFAEIGWLAGDDTTVVPGNTTQWQSDAKELTTEKPVLMSWNSPESGHFVRTIQLDSDYMFTVKQKVENRGSKPLSVMPYGLVNRRHHTTETSYYISHEGPLGVLGGRLEEETYDTIKDDRLKEYKNTAGWLGITDKYWVTALIPQLDRFDAKFSYNDQNGQPRFQTDYLGDKFTVQPGESKEVTVLFFAGAKKVSLLDRYAQEKGIQLFDRAIDFGWFYFLTKPMFYALKFFYSHVGNFGIAIMILTVCVKLLMFPLATKSFKSMSRMKLLNPEIIKLREQYGNDKQRLNKEVMELYKREKVNPLSGCLPLLIQIPVFFSLYKVIFITIEMRHAPFYGWIRDLSAPDPTSLFNLFGFIPWNPPSFLMLGVWPIVMGITMYLQQLMNPAPADPVQAKIMKFLPLIFTFMFATFPAGLVIYWSWSNSLSILQQGVISRGVHLRGWRKGDKHGHKAEHKDGHKKNDHGHGHTHKHKH